MRKTLLRLFSVFAAVLLVAGTLSAQIAGSGSIQGTISDPSGAVIPGATIVATNAATGMRTERQTAAAGLYVLSPLPAGQYSVTVAASGFQTVTQQHVTVDAHATVGFELILLPV